MSKDRVIANVTATNRVRHDEYKKWSSAAMRAYGVAVCVRDGKMKVPRSDWASGRLVNIKFPGLEATSMCDFTVRAKPVEAL